jgi:hypothetical protein
MPDHHEQIADLEVEIGKLADAAERCRKVMLVTRMGIALGALLIITSAAGLIRLSPTVFVIGIAATVGGIALFGSTRSTREQLLTTIFGTPRSAR